MYGIVQDWKKVTIITITIIIICIYGQITPTHFFKKNSLICLVDIFNQSQQSMIDLEIENYTK